MDDTTQSRVSDAAAAASKKRRSSILKNQRSIRTPFSELEFNVTTPPDTTKSRRVSFSRRTGVAEFATNEATTTWKNFYEEHNKSLESSGNDSGNSSKQIGHIGKRLFDQQFEEVEADLIGSLNPGFNYNSSINNVNFGQITIVDNTADIKLSNTQRNFELSNLTSTQSKVFGDDLTMPQMCENSQTIDVNFSAINQIGGDDLDEIQKDLQNNQNVRHHPFDRQNVSEYIEVDLNCTHITVQNVESDMSITDTIHSPEVQEVSKSVSIEKVPTKDWVTDKENIAVNPYTAPKESMNFAVNEEPEKVLVFDGKRLTLQPDVPEAIENCPEPKNVQPQRKTIVLNVHDDLPNFIDNPQSTSLGYISVADLKQNTEFDSDMSITKTLPKSDQSQSQKTVVFDDEGDISFTQAIISNIVQEKRRTIVYEKETGNISITQAVPTNIIEKTDKTILYEDQTGNLTITQCVGREKRKTIVYDNEEGNISMTEAIPPNIIEQQTIAQADDPGNLSLTKAIPTVIIQNSPEKKQAIIYDDQIGRLSVTQSISSKLADSETKIERRQTVVFENDTGNISVTQVVPGNIILPPNLKKISKTSFTESLPPNMAKRRTIVFDDADISMTQAIPNKILSDINTKEKLEKISTIVFDNENADMSVTQAVDRNMLPAFKMKELIEKRRTVFENSDVSITQAIDPKILSAFENKTTEPSKKRQTVFDDFDISLTQAVKSNMLSAFNVENAASTEKRQTVFDNADISMTQAINVDILPALKTENAAPTEKRQTVFDDADISLTQAVNSDMLSALKGQNAESEKPTLKRHTLFDNTDISMTQALNVDILPALKTENAAPIEKSTDISMTQALNAEILPVLKTENAAPIEKRQTVFNDIAISLPQAVNSDMLSAFKSENAQSGKPTLKRQTVFDNADISMTQAINADILLALKPENAATSEKRQTVFDDVDVPKTQAFNSELLSALNTTENNTEKRQTVFDNADVSITQAIDRDMLPELNKENAGPMPEEKQLTAFDSGVTPMDQTEHNNEIIKNTSNDLRATSITNEDINERRSIIKEDVNERRPISEDVDMTEVPRKKSIAFEDQPVYIYDLPSSQLENEDLDVSMNDINTKNKESIPMTSNVSNIQIKGKQRTNEILVYQISSSGQIQKGTEKGDAKSQPSVNPSSMDVDDEKLASSTKTTDNKNSDDPLKTKEVLEIETDDDGKLSDTSRNDKGLFKSVSHDDNSKSDIVFQKINQDGQHETKSSSTISTFSFDMGKHTVALFKEKDDEQSVTETSYGISHQNLRVNSGPKLTSQLPSTDVIKSDSKPDRKNTNKIKDSLLKDLLDMSKGSFDDFVEPKPNVEVVQSSSISTETQDVETHDVESSDGQPELVKSCSISISTETQDVKSHDVETQYVESHDVETQDVESSDGQPELGISSSLSTEIHDEESSDEQPRTNDILFFITKDNEEMKDDQEMTGDQKVTPTISADVSETSSQKRVSFSLEDQKITKKKQSQNKSHLALEYKEENPAQKENVTESRLQQKLALLKTVYLDSNLPEKPKEVRKSHHHEDENAILKDMNLSTCSKKFKLANDTKELLDMLSDLTEKESPQKTTLDPHLEEEEEEKPEPVVVKGHIALENKLKTEELEPRWKSFLPQRRSKVISREDLLNNISMANAALQKSRAELEDESIDESTISESPEQNISKRRTVRMSDEIVKTLKFDDSISQTINSDTNMTPLKKTAFGETTYMTDPKCKVIPSYLKDVSNDVKELMNDLVKPTAETLPFETAASDMPKKMASTCSIKLQANLITSSQIDINTELVSNPESSNPESPIKVNIDSSTNSIEDAVKSSVTRASKSTVKSVTITTPESSKMMEVDTPRVRDRSSLKAVLVFDHKNPLNNVLLAPPAFGDVHKYNPVPVKNDARVIPYQNTSETTSEKSESILPISSAPDPSSEIIQMNFSNQDSNYQNAMRKSLIKMKRESKPLSVDQSVETTHQGVNNKDINTVIAMKQNKELLEASSSLTLVDGVSDRGNFWSNIEDEAQIKKSEIELIYKESKPEKLIDSDKTSNESSDRQISKKRVYSPAQKHGSFSNLDLTPKPLSKMQKISETPPNSNQNSKDEDKRCEKEYPKKTGTMVTVQQVTAEYDMQDQSPISNKSISIKTDSTPRTNNASIVEIVNSFTSSKNLRADCSEVTSAGWQDPEPEIPNYTSDSEYQTNIFAKLDMLPFMGSHECEWESSTSDLWSFSLLHTCLRLTVRFQHLHERAVRCIRADTPVLDTQLEIMQEEKKNVVAVLCVRFASEAMRYVINSRCRIANDVSRLLKRCARVARLATRWARAMQDLKARLAYSLTDDGLLSLKVANIVLRSVWEIRFKLDMVVNEGGAPFPQAYVLSVIRVLTDRQIQTNELKQVLKDVPMDWGHAPRSIWKVFKYLKYKRDYDVLRMEH